jgi:hypothetical protein
MPVQRLQKLHFYGTPFTSINSLYNYYQLLDVLGTADGGTVVKVLCYKSQGRWFDSRWCHWNFSLI